MNIDHLKHSRGKYGKAWFFKISFAMVFLGQDFYKYSDVKVLKAAPRFHSIILVWGLSGSFSVCLCLSRRSLGRPNYCPEEMGELWYVATPDSPAFLPWSSSVGRPAAARAVLTLRPGRGCGEPTWGCGAPGWGCGAYLLHYFAF